VTGWRFAFSRRWFGYLAVAIVFAIVCVLLSNWQLARRAEKTNEIALVSDNYDARPVAVGELLPDLDSFDPTDEWRPVILQGTYLIDESLLVRNRPRGGQPGFAQLVPFRTTDGAVFAVDRGWLPTGSEQDLPDAIPAPPDGTVTVTVRLRPGEPTVAGRSAGAGQIATIHLPELAERLGQPTYTGAYGLLVDETPAPTDPPPASSQRPVADEGAHLSYAFQWLIFGILGFVFLGYAVRQEYRALNADEPEERRRAEERERRRRARRTDADIEDELLDATPHGR
jgi:cytochrome oxidase assembly protein ShyY1